MARWAMGLALLLVVLTLTGCWDLRVLDDLALVFALGVDEVAENPELVSITATNPAFSPNAEKTTDKRTVQGYSLNQAFMNMQLQSQHILVLGKLNVVVFDMATAKNGRMNEILREMDQRRDINPNAKVCIIDGSTAQELIHLEPTSETRVAIYLEDVFDRSYQEGHAPRLTGSHYWRQSITAGISPVVPVIKITEADGILITGLACINEQGRMAGMLSDSQMIHYMLLSGNMTRGRFFTRVSYVHQKNRTINVLIKKVNRSIKVDIKSDQPVIDIKFHLQVDTLNVDMTFKDHIDEDIFAGLETALAQDLQGNITETLKQTQEWQTDVTGLGQYARVQNPQWSRGRNWAQDYQDAQINVEVRVTIQRIGTLINPKY